MSVMSLQQQKLDELNHVINFIGGVCKAASAIFIELHNRECIDYICGACGAPSAKLLESHDGEHIGGVIDAPGAELL